MQEHFPLTFTLESGTRVVVERTQPHEFAFTLQPKNGTSSHFTYRDDVPSKAVAEEGLEFEQVDALRRFWLKTEDLF